MSTHPSWDKVDQDRLLAALDEYTLRTKRVDPLIADAFCAGWQAAFAAYIADTTKEK
jgi:hypothetical protein